MEDIKRKFVELFYPQELIRLVNKFGQEGTLNQKAMWQINKCVYVYWACILFLFLMFWSDLGFFRSAILFLLLYVPLSKLIKWEIRRNFERNNIPYVNGEKVQVKVIQSRIWGFGALSLIAIYELTSDPKITVRCEAGIIGPYVSALRQKRLSKEDDIPQEGETYFVYQSNLDKSNVMPDIKFFKETYSLTTTIL